MTYTKLEELEKARIALEEERNRLIHLSNTTAKNINTPVVSNIVNEKDYSEYLDKNISPFIEDNIELIDTNNFTELYERADSWLTGDYEHARPYITDYLLACDINPLEHMKKVPREYISGGQDSVIRIPDNIEVIEAQSLNRHNLKHIVLPKNLTQLALNFNIFGGSNDIYLHYPGKESDWKSVCLIEGMDGREYDVYVTCEEDGYKQKYPEPVFDNGKIYINSEWKYHKTFLDKTVDYGSVKWSEIKSNLK